MSLIIAAFFLTKSEGSVKAYHSISRRLIGEKGVEWANLSALTIRSVHSFPSLCVGMQTK
ncbi:MAG: hypothetical protein U9O86_02100 [Campylobacterota bacterium]|nr:hypothetical protein [Campylobacterota bacterium]